MKSLAVVVIDRSGSMASMWKEAENVVNETIKTAKEINDSSIRIVEFDDVVDDLGLRRSEDQSPYKLLPRGSTALYDAIGTAIQRTGEDLDKLPESEKPANIIVTIVTDGEENSSKEYSYDKIHEMIEHQKNKYNWQFVFASSSLKSVNVANALGIQTVGGWVTGDAQSYAAAAAIRGGFTTSYMNTGNVNKSIQDEVKLSSKLAS